MTIVLERSRRQVPKAARHPEVNQENATTLEPKNQILPTPFERSDPLSLEFDRDLMTVEGSNEAVVADLDSVEAATDDTGLEQRADCLDLG